MTIQTLTLTAADGHAFTAYRADPVGTPKGGIVVVQEAFGVNQHIKRVCERFAEAGFAAIAPCFFDRIERGLVIPYEEAATEAGVQKVMGLVARIPPEVVLLDVAAAVAALKDAGKTGIVGFCWGGLIVWHAANAVPGIAAGVGYYGLDASFAPVPPVPMMFHFGGADPHIPVSLVQQFQNSCPQIPIHIYEGADHGFNCDDRAAYHPQSAAIAWERTLGLFGSALA